MTLLSGQLNNPEEGKPGPFFVIKKEKSNFCAIILSQYEVNKYECEAEKVFTSLEECLKWVRGYGQF
jgi:hypothetical protein